MALCASGQFPGRRHSATRDRLREKVPALWRTSGRVVRRGELDHRDREKKSGDQQTCSRCAILIKNVFMATLL